MPSRPVWGFANDDMHGENQMMGNYQFMLMNDLSVQGLKKAMREGAFVISNEPGHTGAALAPRIDSIIVNENNGTINVFARNFHTIRWISGISGTDSTRTGKVIAEGITSWNYGRFDRLYIRIELKNDNGTTLSQPFGFSIQGNEFLTAWSTFR